MRHTYIADHGDGNPFPCTPVAPLRSVPRDAGDVTLCRVGAHAGRIVPIGTWAIRPAH